MAEVPTPIPEYWVKRWHEYWRQRVYDRLWQLILVVAGVTLIVAVIAGGPGFIVAFLIGTTLSVILSDDIRKTVTDIWNRNFWVFRT